MKSAINTRTLSAWLGLSAALAFVLALLSDMFFAGTGPFLLKWLPNVGAVILAFSLTGRRYGLLLIGHAIGLSLSGFAIEGHDTWRQIHHVMADVLETALMLFVLIAIDPDARLQKSSDLIKAGFGVILIPPIASSAVFSLGEMLLGKSEFVLSAPWIAASVGTTSIVLVPWLVARSRLIDTPLVGFEGARRSIRILISLGLVALAFFLPLTGRTQEDALVALLLLMGSTWLPVPVAAALMSFALVLHDGDLRRIVGMASLSPEGSAWLELRACAIAMAAMYVRFLVAESRLALLAAEVARAQQREDSARFERLIEQVDGVVWEAEAETAKFTFVSAAAERMFGYPAHEWLEPGFWVRRMHHEDTAWAPAFCASETRAGRAHSFDYRFVARDGSTIWLRDVVTLPTRADGTLMLAGVMIDVSTLKQTTAALQATKASLDRLNVRHELALAAGGIGIWEADTKTGEGEWDETMYRLFGSEPSSGMTPRALAQERLDAESMTRLCEAFEAMKQGHLASLSLDCTLLLSNGEKRRLRSVIAPMKCVEDGGRIAGATWDCSLEYSAKESLLNRADTLSSSLEDQALEAARARSDADRAEAMQSDLVANVSHELRTPLHAILGFLDLAKEDLNEFSESGNERIAPKLDRASKAAKRLLTQVDELLDLSKLESGTAVLRRKKADLITILQSVTEELSTLILAKSISLRFVLNGQHEQPGIQPTESVWVEVDEVRMVQVLRNVLANAVRFSPQHSTITISIDESPDGRIAVTLQDEGPGIPDDQLDAVFDRFVQAREAPGGRQGGTGLGLPIARHIARAHGGDLKAEHSPAGGRLVLTLPSPY